jgi:hypothetical protein
MATGDAAADADGKQNHWAKHGYDRKAPDRRHDKKQGGAGQRDRTCRAQQQNRWHSPDEAARAEATDRHARQHDEIV